MRQLLFGLTILCSFTVAHGQKEYLVQVDPATCNYTVIDSIPGVEWIALSQTTFDKINHRFIFRGENATVNWFLYSVDASNAAIISNPPFPAGGFGCIRMDNSSGIMYGLNWVGGNVNLITINPANFNYTVTNTINNIGGLSNDATMDEINHRMIFTADDNTGIHRLYSVDVITGNVISSPAFPYANIMGYFVFDNSSGILYGLRWSSTPGTSVFVSIDPANANYTVIGTIPYDLSGGIPMGYQTFDEINKRYTISARDANDTLYLYTIDAISGQVIFHPPFPAFVNPHNLIETKYDNSTGNLYALHWGIEGTTGIMNNYEEKNYIYPNPFSTLTTLHTNKIFKNATLIVYNAYGYAVKQIAPVIIGAGQSIILHRDGLPVGIYFLRLAEDSKTLVTLKLVIVDN